MKQYFAYWVKLCFFQDRFDDSTFNVQINKVNIWRVNQGSKKNRWGIEMYLIRNAWSINYAGNIAGISNFIQSSAVEICSFKPYNL